MHIKELFRHIENSNDFQSWCNKIILQENNIVKFTPNLGVNLTSKCNMNCEHCCFKEYLNQDEEFDYEKFYIFLEKYLIEFKNDGHDSLKLHFNCGELTLLPANDLLKFLDRCLNIYTRHKMKLSFRINSNLKNIGNNLMFFILCKDICDAVGKEFTFYTSIDYYHFDKGFFEEHYKNIKRLQDIGIKVIANTVIKNRDELLYIMEKYKPLNLTYVLQLLKDYEELENPCNNFNTIQKTYSEFQDIIKLDNVDVSYHVNGCHRFPLKAIYTYNNTIVQCPFFAPYKFNDDLNIDPELYTSIDDIYQSKLFLIQRYLIDNIKNSIYDICPITYYYNQNFHTGEISND